MVFDEQALRQRGIRLTPQRRMILDVIAQSNGHITAEDIHQRISSAYPDISLSTVYRNLERLLDLHVVSVTDMGGGRLCYQIIGERPHHHLICHRCGAVLTLDDSAVADLRQHIECVYGFKADIDHLALWGFCAQCRQDINPTTKEETDNAHP